MKKLLAIPLLALSFVAYGGNNFNTLDAAPSVAIGSALPTGTNSIGQVTANAGTNLNTSALALDATVSAQSAKLPSSLGAKTGATSLSVVPNTDTVFPVSGIITSNPGNTANTTPWLMSVSDGSTTASNIPGDSGQNAQVVTGSRKEVSFTTTTAQAVASTDVSNYSWVSVHVVTQGTSSTITFQSSNDNSNWTSAALSRGDLTSPSTSPTAVLTTSANVLYHGPVVGRYFRLSVTGISAGTTAGVVEFMATPRVQTISASTVAGATAHASAIGGNPVRLGGRALTANYTAVTTGQTADLVTSLTGSLITKPYSIPEADWSYVAAAGGISNTTSAVTMVGAAAAGLRNYLTGCQLSSDALGAATEFVIRDGASGTVIWRQKIGTAGLVGGLNVTFPSPLKSTAATLLEADTLTASITGAVYVNCQGYIAP